MLEFSHRSRPLVLEVSPGQRLALYYQGVLRKERQFAGREPLYVWTNVELEWEEHHYIEARYWPSTGAVNVTVNGEPLTAWELPPAGEAAAPEAAS